MSRLVAYQAQEDGNWDPVAFKREKLKAKEVFILVNEERKEIWIWVGQEADVKTRFISSTAAQEIQRHYGVSFRIHAADQGSEPNGFFSACIDDMPQKGIGPPENSLQSPTTPVRAPTVKKTRGRPRKKTKKTSSKKTTEKRPPNLSQRPLVSEQSIESGTGLANELSRLPSLVVTPKCPKCEKGNLLPFSTVINVTARKKDILPYGKWACSSCQYTQELES